MGSLLVFGSIMLFIQVYFLVWDYSITLFVFQVYREYCRIRIIFFLFQVRFVIMSFITNCLVDGIGEEGKGGEAALSQTLMQIFGGPSGVFAFAQSYPTVRFFISPPNVRNKPTWFPRFRPVVLQALQQIMSNRPPNLQILEDKPGELDPDGIHFSLMAGILYVQDLHDQAVQLMLAAVPDPKIR